MYDNPYINVPRSKSMALEPHDLSKIIELNTQQQHRLNAMRQNKQNELLAYQSVRGQSVFLEDETWKDDN